MREALVLDSGGVSGLAEQSRTRGVGNFNWR